MNKAADFVVGGMQPLTMIDFPGKLATVIFAQGCNLRCRFCHNTTLLADRPAEQLKWRQIINFLKDRQGFIEGVVFSGGEPCRQASVIEAMAEVRELGFDIAVHTNGFFPEIIEKAAEERLLKFVAVDFKAPFSLYPSIAGTNINEREFARVAEILVSYGISHEYRTTFHPQLFKETDLMNMSEWLLEKKISNYVIQQFRFGEVLDKTLSPVMGNWLSQSTILKLRSRFSSFCLRGENSTDQTILKAA